MASKLSEQERVGVRKFLKYKHERGSIQTHNILESLKILLIIPIGLVVGAIFFLAQLRIFEVYNKFPIPSVVFSILMWFLYACIFHDLVLPYTHINLKKYPKDITK